MRKKLLEEPKIRQGMEEESSLLFPTAASVGVCFFCGGNLHRAVFPTFHTGHPCGTQLSARQTLGLSGFHAQVQVLKHFPQCEGGAAVDKRGLPYAIRCVGPRDPPRRTAFEIC